MGVCFGPEAGYRIRVQIIIPLVHTKRAVHGMEQVIRVSQQLMDRLERFVLCGVGGWSEMMYPTIARAEVDFRIDAAGDGWHRAYKVDTDRLTFGQLDSA